MSDVPRPDLLRPFRARPRLSRPVLFARPSCTRRHRPLSPLPEGISEADSAIARDAGVEVAGEEDALLGLPGAWLRIAGEHAFHPQPALRAVLGAITPDADLHWLHGPSAALPWARAQAEGLPEGHLRTIHPVCGTSSHARLAFAAFLPEVLQRTVAGRETLQPLLILHAPGALLLLAGSGLGGCANTPDTPDLLCAWPLP